MLMLFPRFDKLSTTKNTNATFFSSRRKYMPNQTNTHTHTSTQTHKHKHTQTHTHTNA